MSAAASFHFFFPSAKVLRRQAVLQSPLVLVSTCLYLSSIPLGSPKTVQGLFKTNFNVIKILNVGNLIFVAL